MAFFGNPVLPWLPRSQVRYGPDNMFWVGSTVIVYGILTRPMILHVFLHQQFSTQQSQELIGILDSCGCGVVPYIQSGSNQSDSTGGKVRMMYIPTAMRSHLEHPNCQTSQVRFSSFQC